MPWDTEKDTWVGRAVSFFKEAAISLPALFYQRRTLMQAKLRRSICRRSVNSTNWNLKEWTDGLYVTGSSRIKISSCLLRQLRVKKTHLFIFLITKILFIQFLFTIIFAVKLFCSVLVPFVIRQIISLKLLNIIHVSVFPHGPNNINHNIRIARWSFQFP